jgi:hypothetical protein
MIITEKDVGRLVRMRNGKTTVIQRVGRSQSASSSNIIFNVHTTSGDVYTNDGKKYHGLVSDYDLVEFVGGHSTVELSEAPSITAEDADFEDNGQFIQKVPSAESNAKRFLKMLEAQGIYELVVVTDMGELRCEIYRDKKGEG